MLKEIQLVGSRNRGGAENTPGNHCKITHPNRKIEMSVSTAASSTPNPARCKDAGRRSRNHWKAPGGSETTGDDPRASGIAKWDRGGASSAAEMALKTNIIFGAFGHPNRSQQSLK
jgi:hypothetical protein